MIATYQIISCEKPPCKAKINSIKLNYKAYSIAFSLKAASCHICLVKYLKENASEYICYPFPVPYSIIRSK